MIDISLDRDLTEIEYKLIKIWKEILHIDQVCIDDNFLNMGGHSLSIVALEVKI